MKQQSGSLSFLVDGNDILLVKVILDRQTRVFNGVETLIAQGQSIESQTVKELYAQLKITVNPEELQHVGSLTIRTATYEGKIFSEITLTIFILKNWQGEPQATPGIQPEWFVADEIDYENTIDHFQYWLPELINRQRVFAEILYQEDLEKKETSLKDVILR